MTAVLELVAAREYTLKAQRRKLNQRRWQNASWQTVWGQRTLFFAQRDWMRTTRASCLALFALLACGCYMNKTIAVSAEQTEIRALDAQMVRALNAGDFSRWYGFMADDVVFMPANEDAIAGKAAVQKWMGEALGNRKIHVVHHLSAVEVSRGGDIAYTSYEFEFVFTDSDGKTATVKGKDLSVFRKQADGSWKLARDMWSANREATN